MRKRSSRRVSPIRYLFGLAVLFAWCTGCVFLARQSGVAGIAGGIAAGFLFTVPLASLGEWLVHGVVYHGRLPGLGFIRTIHHQGHHFALFPPSRYVQDGPYEFMRFRKPLTPFRMADNGVDNFLTKYSQVSLHFVTGVPLILAPAWFSTHSIAFFASTLASLAFVSWWLAEVHGAIHTPRNRWIERQSWFCWLDRHHYIHHIDLQANINFGLPICDFLFGTQKAALTPAEAARHPSFEQAKPMAKDIVQPAYSEAAE